MCDKISARKTEKAFADPLAFAVWIDCLWCAPHPAVDLLPNTTELVRRLLRLISKPAPRSKNAAGKLNHMPLAASQAFMSAISASCAAMTSSASLRISGSLPNSSCTFAMSMAA